MEQLHPDHPGSDQHGERAALVAAGSSWEQPLAVGLGAVL